MRILVLSFYFKPDLSAGSFRASSIVEGLVKEGGSDLEIDVFTTMPNRYHSYSASASEHEMIDSVSIRRFRLPVHRSGMLDQSRAFISFARQVFRAVGEKNYDLVFATSSRLMTAVLGAKISRRYSIPLYLDIRDIFTMIMREMLAGKLIRVIMPLFYWIERYALKSARKINIVSGGFEEHVKRLAPDKPLSIYPNGIDDEFLAAEYVNHETNPCPVVLYAGNIGEGQGLHSIIPKAAQRLEGEVQFLIVGDGGARHALESSLEKNNVKNVTLMNPVSRAELLELYRKSDYLFLHLNKYESFCKVLPSKIFEYAATGKPVLAGVEGYARRFIRDNVDNSVVFDSCDSDALVEAIKHLQPGVFPREEFKRKYARANISSAMAKDILNLLQVEEGAE